MEGINFGKLQQYIPGFKFGGGTIGDIISSLLTYIFAGAGILVLLYLLFGGFQLITSLGDPKGMQEAKNKITYAILGFVIIFLAYWITQAASLILGLEGIKSIFQ